MYRPSTRKVVPALIALACSWPASANASETPVVYVRCARTTATLDLEMEVVVGGSSQQVSRTMTGLDVYDVLPDVTNFLSGFSAPCDLMLHDGPGVERVLYDCSSTSTTEAACAAMDPAVSLDGRSVAFTVFRGSLQQGSEAVHPRVVDPSAQNTNQTRVALPNRLLSTMEAGLYVIDVASGTVRALPHVPGTYDTGPAFLPSGRLAFTSTRDGHTSSLVFGTNSSIPGTRIWSMDLDGNNLDLASHHSLAQEQHPFVLKDGRVVYSSWQIFGGLSFRHTNGSPGGFTTIGNLFHLFTQNPDGSDQFAFFGQHAGDHTPITSVGVDHKAAHFVTQTSDGRVWFADYYRGNNSGLGEVLGMTPEPPGQEGIGPTEATVSGDVYAPREMVRFAPWSTSSDSMAKPMPAPALRVAAYSDPLPFAGKVGHPSALPGGGLMVVWGKGGCGTVSSNAVFERLGRPAPPITSGSGSGSAMNVFTSLALDSPGCDAGLYRATTIPSAHPSDLELVVDSREWHEIQPRALVPYAAIHGLERPGVIARADVRAAHAALAVGTPFGLLGAASILDRETHPRGGVRFQGESQFHNQGTDTIDYSDDDLCGVRILGVMPNRGVDSWKQLANVAGERVRILGEIPVRHTNADGAPRMDPSGHPDTSFLVRIPADVPYLMQGIDCEGRTLNTDQTWQSLRPGEQKTCGGCHVHSKPARVDFAASFAATPDYVIPKLGEGTVPLLAGRAGDGSLKERVTPGYGLAIDFQEDILPIFERRCVSCHGGDTPAAGLALDRPGTDRDSRSTWYCVVSDRSQSCVPEPLRHATGAGAGGVTFRRPQLTRYVRAFNSLASLLYWKAAGRRTDKRTDATYSASDPAELRDIDFGAAHTTQITPEELGLLARWIDIGSPGGAEEGRDTQRPTLHLSATVSGKTISALHVGTVDLGTGVDPDSLEVCLVADGACGAVLPAMAEPHGVVRIELAAPLSDDGQIVRARVRDRAGNETIVERSVAWLRSAPPPVGAGSQDAGVGDADPAMSSGEERPGGCDCRAGAEVSSSVWPMTPLLAAWLVWRRRRHSRGGDA
ncbi:MAG: PD40 domain-containing protein [Labilithrix sp.]|nr:PD40 domain-containing protein [Labilithrix sp.]